MQNWKTWIEMSDPEGNYPEKNLSQKGTNDPASEQTRRHGLTEVFYPLTEVTSFPSSDVYEGCNTPQERFDALARLVQPN